jgi:hypothetical protein
MDKLSAVNLTFDKLLITVLIPGLVAIFPYLLLIYNLYPDFYGSITSNYTYVITLVTILSLIFGLIIENIGSRIEVEVFDKVNKCDSKIWEKFLKLSYEKEPVGHRYLRNILMRMKFELGLFIALIFMAIGLIVFNYKFPIFESQCSALIFLFIIPIALAVFLYKEGLSSSKVLNNTRILLVEEFYRPRLKEAQVDNPSS